jgi:hypothetical protein
MKWIATCFFALIASASVAAESVLQVVIPPLHTSAREHASYFPKLLQLALDKTAATDGPYTIRHHDQQLTSPRQETEIRLNGVINVMWDGSNEKREVELLPIRISLLRQLNDYRVFLIRREDLPKFAAVRSIDALRKYSAGAGVNWPSTDVLRANGLPVVTSIAYEYLFPMLAVKRFDYMPRGIHEVWFEQQVHADKGFVIEPTIFLHYSVPYYFFVSRDNSALANRIERGLQIAQKDGSFDALFLSFPAFRRSLDEIKAGKRRVFELKLPQ